MAGRCASFWLKKREAGARRGFRGASRLQGHSADDLAAHRRAKGPASPFFYSPPPAPDIFAGVKSGVTSVEQMEQALSREVPAAALGGDVWSFGDRDVEGLIDRLVQASKPLAEYCGGQIYMGIKSGLSEAFVIDAEARNAILHANPEAEEIVWPFLNGRDVRRYHVAPTDAFVIYTYHGVPIERYPAVERHLRTYRAQLESRATRQEWYELQQPQYKFKPHMAGPKIIFPDIAKTPRFALDELGRYSSNTTYFIPGRDLYLLGLLNSRLGWFYFSQTCAGLESQGEVYLRFFGQYMAGFPVRIIDPSSGADRDGRERMVALVERMLALHAQLPLARTDQERAVLERQIAATDSQIDQVVYELYGLTDQEIAIIEGNG